MLVFLDTEFTDFLNQDLISIGLVTLDGQNQFYAERTDFNYDWCSDFTRSAVWSGLGMFPAAKMKMEDVRTSLLHWLTALPVKPVLACDSQSDWDLLLDVLPPGSDTLLACRYDLRPAMADPVFNAAMTAFHSKDKPWHHALFDAQSHRAGWLAMNPYPKNGS